MKVSIIEVPLVPLHRVDTFDNTSFYTSSVAQNIPPQLHRRVCIGLLSQQWCNTRVHQMIAAQEKVFPLCWGAHLVEGIVRSHAENMQVSFLESLDGVLKHCSMQPFWAKLSILLSVDQYSALHCSFQGKDISTRSVHRALCRS